MHTISGHNPPKTVTQEVDPIDYCIKTVQINSIFDQQDKSSC